MGCYNGLRKVCSLKYINIHSPVAQLVEHVAVNHAVLGSSPSGGAKKQNLIDVKVDGVLFFGPEEPGYAISATKDLSFK